MEKAGEQQRAISMERPKRVPYDCGTFIQVRRQVSTTRRKVRPQNMFKNAKAGSGTSCLGQKT